MTIRLAVTVNNLRAHKPRGVARVARAIAEQLADDPRFEAYVVAFLSFDRVDVVAGEHWRLSDYLDKVPLDISEAEPPPDPAGSKWFARWLVWLAKRFAWLLLPSIATPSLRVSRWLGLYIPARAVYRGLRWRARPVVTVPRLVKLETLIPRLGPVSLNRFDALISFEAYEDIWQWPTETLRCKTVLIAHDAIPLRIDEGSGGRPEDFFRAMSIAVLRTDRIACNSRATERDILNFFPASAGKTFLAPLGHDRARFVRARALLGKREHSDIKRLVVIGDIDRRKNLQNVLRALPLLPGRCGPGPIEFTIVGNSGKRHEFAHLERIAAKHVFIRWAGYQSDDDAARLIAESDLVLVPSLWEGFGIPVLEAMSAGVSVVCSDVASLPEVGGPHPIYFDPYDPESIADAIAQGLSMPEPVLQAHVAAASAWAAQFTWARCAEAVATEIVRTVRDDTALQNEVRADESNFARLSVGP